MEAQTSNRALGYCRQIVQRPRETILILLSDLVEGGNREEMLRRAGSLAGSGVHLIVLLALNDDGAPAYDHDVASAIAGFGISSFACTPDKFHDLMAAPIQRRWSV